jgi:hypothetical protein
LQCLPVQLLVWLQQELMLRWHQQLQLVVMQASLPPFLCWLQGQTSPIIMQLPAAPHHHWQRQQRQLPAALPVAAVAA